VKRSKAADLLDDIRCLAAETDRDPAQAMAALRAKLEGAGLAPLEACGGEAHSNPFIDNCGRCAPRWGLVGPKEPIT
jgi:hypothetical protein